MGEDDEKCYYKGELGDDLDMKKVLEDFIERERKLQQVGDVPNHQVHALQDTPSSKIRELELQLSAANEKIKMFELRISVADEEKEQEKRINQELQHRLTEGDNLRKKHYIPSNHIF
ncbi:kinesin-1-like protein [Corchorus capsularis]|uniref:Kinesin-1-like protein n=1 Tax=Corchorus capsularis TaxID=210143 RepID=A0A1R3JEV5_COCAP|nr:kinesin-1-like protein [Corchorus capsularis]